MRKINLYMTKSANGNARDRRRTEGMQEIITRIQPNIMITKDSRVRLLDIDAIP